MKNLGLLTDLEVINRFPIVTIDMLNHIRKTPDWIEHTFWPESFTLFRFREGYNEVSQPDNKIALFASNVAVTREMGFLDSLHFSKMLDNKNYKKFYISK